MGSKNKNKTTPEHRTLTLIMSGAALVMSTVGVFAQSWIQTQIPSWWEEAQRNILLLTSFYCAVMVFLIYPVCCIVRHMHKGKPFGGAYRNWICAGMLTVEVAIWVVIYKFCIPEGSVSSGYWLGTGLFFLCLMLFLFAMTYLGYVKLTTPNDGTWRDITEQLMDKERIFVDSLALAGILVFLIALFVFMYPYLQAAHP